MSDRAQRVLDALIEYDYDGEYAYPLISLHDFVTNINGFEVSEDYESLTDEEERQVIEAFLEHSY